MKDLFSAIVITQHGSVLVTLDKSVGLLEESDRGITLEPANGKQDRYMKITLDQLSEIGRNYLLGLFPTDTNASPITSLGPSFSYAQARRIMWVKCEYVADAVPDKRLTGASK